MNTIQMKNGNMWKTYFTKNASKDKALLKRPGLDSKAKKYLI